MTENHPRSALVAVLLICAGGFAGSNLRYLFDLVFASPLVPTLTVNVLGCGALGFFVYEKRFCGRVGERAHLVLLTGFISSFTTYSTFVVDAVQSRPAVAISYVIATYALGFLAVIVGREGAKLVATSERETIQSIPDSDVEKGGE